MCLLSSAAAPRTCRREIKVIRRHDQVCCAVGCGVVCPIIKQFYMVGLDVSIGCSGYNGQNAAELSSMTPRNCLKVENVPGNQLLLAATLLCSLLSSGSRMISLHFRSDFRSVFPSCCALPSFLIKL